jgi:hypothetical protein
MRRSDQATSSGAVTPQSSVGDLRYDGREFPRQQVMLVLTGVAFVWGW